MLRAAMSALTVAAQSTTDTIWLVFTWVILLPALAAGLIVVAIVSARGEKRANSEYRGRWGRAAVRRDDE